MKEADFNRRVNEKLNSKLIRSWKIIDDYQGGVPDNYYHLKTAPPSGHYNPPLFVEYKFIKKLPARSTTKIVPDLSEQQALWLEELNENGSEPWVIVGYKDAGPAKGVIFDYYEAMEGLHKEAFVARLLSYKEIAEKIEKRLGV